jgi:hypothetical protein
MSLKASEIIAILAAAIQRHGDLPCYLADQDIASMKAHPTTEGAESFENGKRVNIPTELTLEFVAG